MNLLAYTQTFPVAGVNSIAFRYLYEIVRACQLIGVIAISETSAKKVCICIFGLL